MFGMSSELFAKVPDPKVLLDMEPEEIARVLLPIFKKREQGGNGVHMYNYIRELYQLQEQRFPPSNVASGYTRNDLQKVESALMEAVDWMVSAGLLAHKPDSSSSLLFFVTRRG